MRAQLAAHLSALLRWQAARTSVPMPRPPRAAPDATPFVALYARGRTCGCLGATQGTPAERVTRAFVNALEDARFGPVTAAERGTLAAQLSYLRAARRLAAADPTTAIAQLEPGTHGVALRRPDASTVLILPSVAREHGWDARALLTALARKAGLADITALGAPATVLYRFEAEEIAAWSEHRVRGDDEPGTVTDPAVAASHAARWLAERVGSDGAVEFALEADGTRRARGEGYHARAALCVSALETPPRQASAARRARDFLAAEIHRALASGPVAAWPAHPAQIAGTLALAALAEVPGAHRALGPYAMAHARTIATEPWHAAQVALALGPAVSAEIYRACVADLEPRPFAPWTAMAARARGDGRVLARAAAALTTALRSRPPHAGGAAVTAVPELALTAAAIEALAPLDDRAARAAVARGRAFLLRWQWTRGRLPASAVEPRAALGAFPSSPVGRLLRCDVTAHCVLALAGASRVL